MAEYRSLNPVSMRSMRIGYLLSTIVFAVAAIVTFIFRDRQENLIHASYTTAALAVLFAVLTVAFPRIYYNHYKYYISEDRVDVRCGIIFLRHTVVPIERIHQVEVVAGPVNRMFGLADVQITTAGGTADIKYLEKDEADRIADELNMTVDRIVRGQRE